MDKIDTLKANIERIRTVKYNIADTITSKGVNTDTTEKFELFASKIRQISGSGSSGGSGNTSNTMKTTSRAMLNNRKCNEVIKRVNITANCRAYLGQS